MTKGFRRILTMAAAALSLLLAQVVPVQAAAPGTDDVTRASVAAAEAFLGTLTPEQRGVAALAYGDSKKSTWHNGPPSMLPRQGVKLGALSADQRNAAMALLKAMTGTYGYDKVVGIMTADQYFGRTGARFATGPDAYSVAIYGKPSLTEPWMFQWNGHHLGLNVTVVGREKVLSPSLTGAFPSTYVNDAGATVKVMENETSRAFKLMNSLSQAQQAKAILKFIVQDLVLGPGRDGQVIQPEGLKGSEMTAAQKAMMLDLTAAWIDILPPQAAAAKLDEVRRNLDDTYFAWSGETNVGERAYFRVQGPTVFIEYAPQVNVPVGPAAQGGGNAPAAGPPNGEFAQNTAPPAGENLITRQRDPNHVHTMFRDFTNDYASKLVK